MKTLVILILLSFATLTFVRQVVALEPVEAAATGVDYALPYPGMLPDNPLYFLKVARDQALGYFITDPTQKSFYFLLLSDKRLGAGAVLVKLGKQDLGKTTLSKGEQYFSAAVDLAIVAKKSGKDVSDLLAKLTIAGAKHSEILTKSSADQAYHNNLQTRNRIMELLLQK